MQWYYTKQRQQLGPVDEEELHRLAEQGELLPEDLVWNPSMGEQWAPASSVEGLFPPDDPELDPMDADPMPYPGTGGATPNSELMRRARESLASRWGFGVGVMLLYYLVLVAANMVPAVGQIANLVISGPMMVGFCFVFLMLARRREVTVGQLFQGFNRFGTALGTYLLMAIFIFLWCLLLVIPGIIAAYSYAMAFFVLADDPDVSAMQAITRSKEMMRGNKWKLFCLCWRFFGWGLLCILTLGFGFLWLAPYVQTSLGHFYDDIRPPN